MNIFHFSEFRGDLTDDELRMLVKLAKKRRMIYLIIHVAIFMVAFLATVIVENLSLDSSTVVTSVLLGSLGILMGIFAGFGCWTHNVICFVSSKGNKQGGGIVSVIWAIFGCLIVPLVIVTICKFIFPYKSILGWGKAGITFGKVRI